MINSEDFVEEYVSNCIDRGISSTKAICEEALREMEEINKKIREENNLRTQYKNLKHVLRHFNHESVRRTKTNDSSIILNEFSSITDSSYYDIMIKICQLIDMPNKIYTSREIMDSISGLENNTETYICIKDLADKGIIERDINRNLVKGPKWNERPLENK